jgi:hypothetical protein
MAQYQGSLSNDGGAAASGTRGVSGLAVGVTVFASVVLVLMGIFHIIEGVAAIVDGTLYGAPENYSLDIGVKTWGWLQLTAGIVVLFSGFFLMSGDRYARGVAYVVVLLSALGNFVSIPYYPVWSVVLIGLDVVVLWALSTYSRQVVG